MLKEEVHAELQKHGIAADDKMIPGIAYKNVVSNGLVLDKNGNKMSKRLGNAVDPFVCLPKYGADAVRWYMISNAAPWDNLKFDEEGISEVQRNLFGTLYNTYNFFALYANIDGFSLDVNKTVPYENLSELDRWIISKLQTLIKETSECYDEFEPHRAARLIENFVDRHLSNWYVRLSRRRFWKQDNANSNTDKRGAYETLFECLKVTAQLMSPIAPFFSDWLYKNLQASPPTPLQKRGELASVHLSNLPISNNSFTNNLLEERMDLAQNITSMILSIRKKENIRVRQPLSRIQIPILSNLFKESIQHFEDLIKAEVNVKAIEYVTEAEVQIVKNMKLNFKTLGKKYGAFMKAIQTFANENSNEIIRGIELGGEFTFDLSATEITLLLEDVEILPVDIPGWKVANSGNITVALDIQINEELKNEGIAREIVNRIQNLRKDKAFEVTDKINVLLQSHNLLNASVGKNIDYIRDEILAVNFEIVDHIADNESVLLDIEEGIATKISIEKV
jgi:isoleucyl-tRNA synthetase